MTCHFGVLIPSTNTTAETEYSRLLPPFYQAHYARLQTSSREKSPFAPPRDEDLDYQARMLGTARVSLASPYSAPVNARAKHYFESGYGLDIVALEGFAATDSYAIGQLGPENARDAFARIDRPEIDAFAVPGGNFPTMASIARWEAEFAKPVVTTNQASIWAVARAAGGAPIPGLGRLLAELPPG